VTSSPENNIQAAATAADLPATGSPGPAVPHILCNAHAVTARLGTPGGALWKLAEPGRQLDANLIHQPRGQRVDTHAEPDLDVLLLVLAGDGVLGTADETIHLTGGTMLWLPRGSSRSLAAGEDGISYLTVHRRRPGMQIRSRGNAPGSGALA
jgi:quercetin dioxygenase-like cupin family protein